MSQLYAVDESARELLRSTVKRLMRVESALSAYLNNASDNLAARDKALAILNEE